MCRFQCILRASRIGETYVGLHIPDFLELKAPVLGKYLQVVGRLSGDFGHLLGQQSYGF
jgi:hypothetical protein